MVALCSKKQKLLMNNFPIKKIIFSILLILTNSCSQRETENYTVETKDGIRTVINHRPAYENAEFVTLKKILSIDTYSDDNSENSYEVSQVTSWTADENDNLYVLSGLESTITVFDKDGKHLRTMGQPGEGPRDLYWPSSQCGIAYKDNKLYILEGISLKVWDVYGNYVQKLNTLFRAYFNITPVQDRFLALTSPGGNSGFEGRDFFVSRKDENFSVVKEKLLYRWYYDRDWYFNPRYVFAVTQDSYLYFPENSEVFSINKYDENFDKILSFGKNYERIPFSEETDKIHQDKLRSASEAGRIISRPEYPPVIRKIMVDSRDNVWVTSGELFLEGDEQITDGTIDIFNKEGILLYSFVFKGITYESFINNDRLYTVTPVSRDTGKQFMEVFEITYNY